MSTSSRAPPTGLAAGARQPAAKVNAPAWTTWGAVLDQIGEYEAWQKPKQAGKKSVIEATIRGGKALNGMFALWVPLLKGTWHSSANISKHRRYR